MNVYRAPGTLVETPAEPSPAPETTNGYQAEYAGVSSVPDAVGAPQAFELPAWLSTRASYIRELKLIIADLTDLKERIENV